MSTLREFFLFIGPPGAGKGSLAALCVNEFGWEQLSTGNLCRKHISQGTQIGKKIDFAIKSGKLVSDELITEMVSHWLLEQSETAATVILDGFPRTLDQVRGLFELLEKQFDSVRMHAIKLAIDDEQVVARIIGRTICSNNECQTVYSMVPESGLSPRSQMVCDECESELIRRTDDTAEMIKDRLAVYHEHEQSLLEALSGAGQEVVELDVHRSLNEVFDDFKKIFVEKSV